MSQHLVKSSATSPKTVCLECGRNVRTVVIEGAQVALDTELIAVVEYSPTSRRNAGQRIVANRVHAELCETYQREAERQRIRDEAKAAELAALAAKREASAAADRARANQNAITRASREAAAEAARKAKRKASLEAGRLLDAQIARGDFGR